MLILARTVNIFACFVSLIQMFNTHITLYYSIYHVYNVPVIFCQSHSQFRYVSMYC